MARIKHRIERLRHNWLPADDPANCQPMGGGRIGYWVPTEAEIDASAIEIRRGWTAGNASAGYGPAAIHECSVLIEKRKITEDSRLCDSSYWGTEFS